MLQAKKSISSVDVMDKKVLLRVDFNVPVKDGRITNDYRIRSAIPTIQKVLEDGGSCILMSHLGRPKGVSMHAKRNGGGVPGFDKPSSLRPVAGRLSELLGKPVAFAPDCLSATPFTLPLKPGEVVLLENVRFYTEEGSKSPADRTAMATVLASYGDMYISDAFGTAHRESATMTDLPRLMGGGAAGYLMEKEITYFAKVLSEPPRPLAAIVGGAKVSDKMLLLENMLPRIDYLLIGGAMAYTFLKAQGHAIGISMCESDKLDLATSLLKKAAEKNVQVLLPCDHVCNKEFKETDTPLITDDVNIPDGYMGLDIGPKSIKAYLAVISKCGSAIWNGPMGVFEKETYSSGTFSVATALANATEAGKLLSVIGGGDSASAAELCGEAERISHVSTGGGASLELLEGKQLPGVTVLTNVGEEVGGCCPSCQCGCAASGACQACGSDCRCTKDGCAAGCCCASAGSASRSTGTVVPSGFLTGINPIVVQVLFLLLGIIIGRRLMK